MSTIINTGPGVATRKTNVSRMPFWKPAEGEWVFLPVDKAHNQQVVEEDREGNSLGSVNLYESKGWMPLRYMQNDAKAMEKLPTNWQEVARHGDQPIYQKAAKSAEKVEAAPKGDGGSF